METARAHAKGRSRKEALAVLLLLLGSSPVFSSKMKHHNEDATRARMSARSIATTWAARVAAAARKGSANDDLPPRLLLDVTTSLEPAIERNVAFETVDAWNTERFELATALIAYADVIEQEWVAVLDRRVCPTCAGLDGQRQPLGSMFEYGGLTDLMAPLHGHCRCFIEFEAKRIALAS